MTIVCFTYDLYTTRLTGYYFVKITRDSETDLVIVKVKARPGQTCDAVETETHRMPQMHFYDSAPVVVIVTIIVKLSNEELNECIKLVT